MNSGCICCSLVGDFGTSLKEVLNTYHPDRILIEPSGVGKLSDVMKAVQNAGLGTEVELNSAVAVVDASKCKMYIKNFGEFFINQIEHAGTIILSRTDVASEEKVKQAVELIREHNEKATIITTPLAQLEGKEILATIEGAKDLEAELMEQVKAMHDDHDHHHHHHADEIFTSWGFETPATYTTEEVEGFLKELDNEEKYGIVLRAKGMIPAADGTWIYFDYVPEESNVRAGKPDVTGKICVIGSKLKEAELENLFRK